MTEPNDTEEPEEPRRPDVVRVRMRRDGLDVEGFVADVTRSAVHVEVPIGSARGVVLADDVVLEFTGGGLAGATMIEGEIVFWSSDGTSEFVHVALSQENIEVVRAARKTKRAERVPMRGKRPVRVKLECHGGSITCDGALADISASGLAVVLSTADEKRLAIELAELASDDMLLVKVGLQLPGNESGVQMIGEVRYRMLMRGCVKYGVRFDTERTAEAFPDQTESAVTQMVAFQRTLLRAA